MLAGRLEKTTAKKGFGDTLQCCSSLGAINTGAPVPSPEHRSTLVLLKRARRFLYRHSAPKESIVTAVITNTTVTEVNEQIQQEVSKQVEVSGGEKKRSRREDMNSRKRHQFGKP